MSRVPNELDEQYVFAPQDPSDPVWAADADIAGMQSVDDPNDLVDQRQPVTVRTASGGLDFLNDLTEVVEGLFETETSVVKPKKAPKLDVIATKEMGADKWRGRTAQITESSNQPLVVESDFRRYIELVNLGPGVVYLSSVPSQAGAPNTFPLQVSTATAHYPLRLPTRDDVYAICAAAGTATLGFVELFDLEC